MTLKNRPPTPFCLASCAVSINSALSYLITVNEYHKARSIDQLTHQVERQDVLRQVLIQMFYEVHGTPALQH
jgi:hypothetical protein